MAYLYKKGAVWRLTFYKDGKRADMPVGQDHNKAKIIQASIEQACRDDRFKKQVVETLIQVGILEQKDGTVAAASANAAVTWDLAKSKLLDHLKKIGRKPTTIKIYERAFKHLENSLKPARPSDITPEKADEFIGLLLDNKNGSKPVRAGGACAYLRALKSAFKKFARWRFVEKNPFVDCEMPKCDAKLPRPLTDEEIGMLLEASCPALKRTVRILYLSGMRPHEYYAITWKRVALDENPHILIMRDGDWHPKAGIERKIPITRELMEALGKPGRPDEKVAGKNAHRNPLNKNWLDQCFRRALKRAKLNGMGITVYSLRDTYATNLALAGATAHVIAARLGHGNITTSMKYVSLASLNTEALKSAKKSWGQKETAYADAKKQASEMLP